MTNISTAEAAANFSQLAQIAKQQGQVIICENGSPKYALFDMEHAPLMDMTDDEKIDVVAARILKRYHAAFEELAK